MSANGWFDVDKTQRLVPLSDEDLEKPVEVVIPQRLTLEKIEFTATDVIAIRFRDLPPPPAPAPQRQRPWVAIALAAAAVVALVCLI